MSDTAAPRTSLILLACNQASTVRAAALSCLAQQGEPLEIVLSDDASTDDTYAVLREVADGYRGPHLVRARRNPVNLGIGAHYNVLMEETCGELLVTAAGDDISLPQRVERLVAAWRASGERAELIASDCISMAQDGTLGERIVLDDLALCSVENWCARRPFTIGATHAFTRRMMQRFGPFVADLWYEDIVMGLRAIMTGGALKVPEALVHYRSGGSSRPMLAASGVELVARARRQNRRVLAEIEQHTRDARVAGYEAQVGAALAPTLARERYLASMIDAPDHRTRWQSCVGAAALPLGWRLRKFVTFSYPEQISWLKIAQARLRGRHPGWTKPLLR
ncbi:MAG TPA: glycosyltransferase [Burkholderiaceae bacterium]|jgi:glycosyltransferase involved in cell wall biosynthesis|nr:glycosyltransferase [Burkholderiaceae bacterium]